jgi:hypothetical protein
MVGKDIKSGSEICCPTTESLATTVPTLGIADMASRGKNIRKKTHHGGIAETGAQTGAPVKKLNSNDGFKTSGGSPPAVPSFDLAFENHGSLCLIRPVSPLGKTWLDENVGDENTMTFGGAVVCEPRYCPAIYQAAIEAGLVVRG